MYAAFVILNTNQLQFTSQAWQTIDQSKKTNKDHPCIQLRLGKIPKKLLNHPFEVKTSGNQKKKTFTVCLLTLKGKSVNAHLHTQRLPMWREFLQSYRCFDSECWHLALICPLSPVPSESFPKVQAYAKLGWEKSSKPRYSLMEMLHLALSLWEA